ncbi:hypothetical protein FHR32_000198 [Streptosporangium album]|uniref:Uncharacterized protein n=1 Tax=Streptosporangium album TaxID=47479 RepID=A0A7W7W6J3_9ACTN|nr:hypothetical protein [Streptosporangium album]MBB4935893.1 hypothetical protein [Streptosporangium album]
MKEIDAVTEAWDFQCLRCLHVWEDVYEAFHADDGRPVVWRRRGFVTTAPWVDRSCPNCSAPQVKPLPSCGRRDVRKTPPRG